MDVLAWGTVSVEWQLVQVLIGSLTRDLLALASVYGRLMHE